MNMTVEQVMSVELVTLSPNHRVYHAMDLMDAHQLRHLPIVDEERRLRGVISDRDVKKLTHANFNTEEESAQERLSLLEEVGVVAHQEPLTVSPDTELSEVAELMLKHKVGSVLVCGTESGELVGIVTRADLLWVLCQLLRPSTFSPMSKSGEETDLKS
ncbi:MAG: hypothetical protein CL920_00175 [Deltaproteobacteria bacterium]|nr:hypothetical protein [Deltaproteobacteria bacterium]|tara:strand:- start:3259 stop:3735 length:477 start_codon:yes stop_codon:yes gene_type:complete